MTAEDMQHLHDLSDRVSDERDAVYERLITEAFPKEIWLKMGNGGKLEVVENYSGLCAMRRYVREDYGDE